jgi:hypothetical protein
VRTQFSVIVVNIMCEILFHLRLIVLGLVSFPL